MESYMESLTPFTATDPIPSDLYSAVCDLLAQAWLVPFEVGGVRFYWFRDHERLRTTGTVIGISVEMKLCTKLHLLGDNRDALKDEYEVYHQLRGQTFVPQIRAFGIQSHWKYLTMDWVGLDMNQLMWQLDDWTPYMTYFLFREMLNCVQQLHCCGFIHGDLKPENFCCEFDIDLDDPVPRIFIIDMETVMRCPANSSRCRGTPTYSSQYMSAGEPLSWRDDLHSMAYILIQFHDIAMLPWKMAAYHQDYEEVLRLKKDFVVTQLDLPACCTEIVQLCLGLDFMEEPPYERMYSILTEAMENRRHLHTPVFCNIRKCEGIPVEGGGPLSLFNAIKPPVLPKPQQYSQHDARQDNYRYEMFHMSSAKYDRLPTSTDDEDARKRSHDEPTSDLRVLHERLYSDPRFNPPTPSPWKRAALLAFVVFLIWLSFSLRLSKPRQPEVVHATRYSKEYKFRPAASPIVTEQLKDGRVRVRGAAPTVR
ncbi:Casein kinase I isoform alpha [Grifola frondosa]|uniref:non-specific serine/threonine protein kinase n=1 Tax=Grifola frondosa TaxID=5627 RepID=A0A1C7M610_GRIFR|nr:Casein kinase I isoform alpha [Grifola frondosa]